MKYFHFQCLSKCILITNNEHLSTQYPQLTWISKLHLFLQCPTWSKSFQWTSISRRMWNESCFSVRKGRMWGFLNGEWVVLIWFDIGRKLGFWERKNKVSNEEHKGKFGFLFFPDFGGMPRHEWGMLRHEANWRFCPRVACRGMLLSGKYMGFGTFAHAAAWGNHAAAWLCFLPLTLNSTFARAKYVLYEPKNPENTKIMICMIKILSNLPY